MKILRHSILWKYTTKSFGFWEAVHGVSTKCLPKLLKFVEDYLFSTVVLMMKEY